MENQHRRKVIIAEYFEYYGQKNKSGGIVQSVLGDSNRTEIKLQPGIKRYKPCVT